MGFFNFFVSSKKKAEVDEQKTETEQKTNNGAQVCAFYMSVENKYTVAGGFVVEGEIKNGAVRIGDQVNIYSKAGKCIHKNIVVKKLLATNKDTQTIKEGDKYPGMLLSEPVLFSDIDYGGIVSKGELQFEIKETEDKKIELPKAATYNDADYATHVRMATKDISSICAGQGLIANKDWVRNVGQDLFTAHGFKAMQDVFMNVTNRYPAAHSQLSSIWDGVGGWAD